MDKTYDELMMKQALERAVNVADGYTELGRLISASRQTVWAMLNTAGKTSPQYVIPIEAATDVSRHDLRPDLYPKEPK